MKGKGTIRNVIEPLKTDPIIFGKRNSHSRTIEGKASNVCSEFPQVLHPSIIKALACQRD